MYSAPDIYSLTGAQFISLLASFTLCCVLTMEPFSKSCFSLFPTENERGPWASVVT